jgi:hypothetical protein
MVRERLLSDLATNDPMQFFEPVLLALLADMADKAPVEYAYLRQEFKKRRIATDIEKALRKHTFVEREHDEADDDPNRRWIELVYDMVKVADEIIAALATVVTLFWKGRRLVRLVGLEDKECPTIVAVDMPTLLSLITSCATLFKSAGRDGEHRELVQPDRLLVEAILARSDYPGMRRLLGVTASPIIHADGTICMSYGYDASSSYFCAYRGPQLPVPDAPTLADAKVALAPIVDLVSEYPFAEPIHRSAWLAGLFTMLLRPVIAGSTPLFFTDSSGPGTGKGKLLDVSGSIVQGEVPVRKPISSDDRELTATLTAALVEGLPVIAFDNAVGAVGGSMLDLVLTAPKSNVRQYGHNDRSLTFEVRSVIFVNGNNCTPRGDLARRVIHVRLDTNAERPETLKFKYTDLVGTAFERRAELLVAALTIVRAYIQEGRPRGLDPLGSFEDWSRWVRDLLVWLGEPDPVETQARFRDLQNAQLSALLGAWVGMFGKGEARTVSEAIEAVKSSEKRRLRAEGELGGTPAEQFEREAVLAESRPGQALLAAFKDLGMISLENPNMPALGLKISAYRNRVCEGRKFVSVKKDHMNAWVVVAADKKPEGPR